MAPSCNLYLSEEDKKIYLDLKGRGENPSAIFSKALWQRAQELDAKLEEMKEVLIYEGDESIHEEGVGLLVPVRFIGKKIASGTIEYDPQFNNGISLISQTLYLTKRLNYLLYEETSEYDKIYYRKTLIEKGKPLPRKKFASAILKVLGVQEDLGEIHDF